MPTTEEPEPEPEPQPPHQGPPAQDDGGQSAAVYEDTHVHGVYEAIAPHFSATRHKPWPFVSSFLEAQPPGAVGLDIGCGNGKNMGVNRDVVMLGCDRSPALAALARASWCTTTTQQQQQPTTTTPTSPAVPVVVVPGADVAVADGLQLPFRHASADFVICIAVVHHLSTRERRVHAIRQLLQCLRRDASPATAAADDACSPDDASAPPPSDAHPPAGGRLLVYVWALEQSSSRRGWDEGNQQDLLVPWVIKAPQLKKKPKKQPPQPRSRKKKQEPAAAAAAAAAEPDDDATTSTSRGDRHGDDGERQGRGGEGGEEDMQGRRQQSHGKRGEGGAHAGDNDDDAGVGDRGATADAGAAAAAEQSGGGGGGYNAEGGGEGDGDGATTRSGGQPQPQPQPQPHTDKDRTFHRFYHLYKKGELEDDVLAAGGRVLRSGYERDNWWVIAG